MGLWLFLCTICCLAWAIYVRTWPRYDNSSFTYAWFRFSYGSTHISRGPLNKTRYLKCITRVFNELKPIIEISNGRVCQGKYLRINKKQCQRLGEEVTRQLANPGKSAEQVCVLKELYCAVRKTFKVVQDCCDERWLLKAVEYGNCQEHFLEVLLDLQRVPVVVKLVHGFKGEALDMMGSEFKSTVICEELQKEMLSAWESDKKDLMDMINEIACSDDYPERFLAHQLDDEPSLVAPLEIEKKVTEFDFLKTPCVYRGANDIIVFPVILFNNNEFMIKMRCSKPVAKEVENPHCWEKLQDEADIMRKCRHPYAVGLLGYWEVTRVVGPKVPLLLLESMECNLKELIKRNKKFYLWGGGTGGFSALEAINLMLPLARVMRHLHKIGVVHRDLKPQNILCSHVSHLLEEISVKLADFGEAQRVDGAHVAGAGRVGTNGYMDPEMWKKRPTADLFKADVFSFGMVFGEVLTGLSPSEALHSMSSGVQKKLERGDRPRLPMDTPEFVKSIVRSCWAASPAQRPSFDDLCWKLQNTELLLVNGFKI